MTVQPKPIISDAFWRAKWDKERLRVSRLEAEVERMRQSLNERQVDPSDIATHLSGGGWIENKTEYRCGICGAVLNVASEEEYLRLKGDGYMNHQAEVVRIKTMGVCPKCQR